MTIEEFADAEVADALRREEEQKQMEQIKENEDSDDEEI
jgi:hypothetical protein